jgi:hypothetical protein
MTAARPSDAIDGIVDTSQPLSKWQDAGNFGSQVDCNALLQWQQFVVQGASGNQRESTKRCPNSGFPKFELLTTIGQIDKYRRRDD